MPKQIVIIHGGMYFETYEEYLEFLRNYQMDLERAEQWEEKLQKDLGEDYQVIRPSMPAKYNSKYEEWKIWFEKFFLFINDDVILIGKSQGGIFLAKYLAENNFPKKIKAVFLLAPPFDDTPDEKVGDFALPKSLEKLAQQGGQIFLLQSEDDPVVPFSHQAKYLEQLPAAQKIVFKDKGHFKMEDFPEIVEMLKNLE